MMRKGAVKIYRSSPVQCGLSVLSRALLFRTATFVLLYHDVSSSPSRFSREHSLCISPEVFEWQTRYLSSHFNVIDVDQFLAGEYEKPAVLITFDDGLPGYFENAAPILDRHGLPSVNFLNLGPVRGALFWSAAVTYLERHDRTFRPWLGETFPGWKPRADLPLFLQVSRPMVEAYFAGPEGKGVEEKVRGYCGPMVSEQVLSEHADSTLVYYGNHLFNHYNAMLLDDGDFEEAYLSNERRLKGYANYRPVFSFPFGQPGTCYSERECGLAAGLGARAIFSSRSAMQFGRPGRVVHRMSPPPEARSETSMRGWLNDVLVRQCLRWL